jgi:hypothetical protein
MEKRTDGVWTFDAPLKMMGVELGARMTVVETGDGLWVHSPIALDEQIKQQVDQLGEVRYIVAPNRFHHMYADKWAAAYPEAVFCAAPGLPDKRDDLDFDHVLTHGDPPWGDALDQQLIDGASMLNEVVFYHPDSRTLVACDLFLNKHDADGLWSRFYCWANGVLNKAGISWIIKFAFGDKQAVQISYNKLLDWDFERIIISHGRPIETNARQTLQRVIDETF